MQKGNAHKHYTLVDKLVSHGITGKPLSTYIVIEQLNNSKSWELSFFLLEWKVIDNQRLE